MIIIPAIDIINKQPVRLYQGDYAQKEVVGSSVFTLAQTFAKAGADYLHLVDLDGAKEGSLINQNTIIEVARSLSIPVEIGGGIRTMEAISFYLEQGLSRVILGTSAMEDENLLRAALNKYGDQIAVGMDCKDGYVYGHGWIAASHLHYLDFAKKMQMEGVKTMIVTDISKDGTLSGPNLEMLKALKDAVSMNIVASGGIRDIQNIKALKNLGIYGAITGKAMYHHTLDLHAAIALCKEG